MARGAAGGLERGERRRFLGGGEVAAGGGGRNGGARAQRSSPPFLTAPARGQTGRPVPCPPFGQAPLAAGSLSTGVRAWLRAAPAPRVQASRGCRVARTHRAAPMEGEGSPLSLPLSSLSAFLPCRPHSRPAPTHSHLQLAARVEGAAQGGGGGGHAVGGEGTTESGKAQGKKKKWRGLSGASGPPPVHSLFAALAIRSPVSAPRNPSPRPATPQPTPSPDPPPPTPPPHSPAHSFAMEVYVASSDEEEAWRDEVREKREMHRCDETRTATASVPARPAWPHPPPFSFLCLLPTHRNTMPRPSMSPSWWTRPHPPGSPAAWRTWR